MAGQLMILQSADLRIRQFRRVSLCTNSCWWMGRAHARAHSEGQAQGYESAGQTLLGCTVRVVAVLDPAGCRRDVRTN